MPYASFPHIGIGFIVIDRRCIGNVTVRVIIVLGNTNISHVHGTIDDIYSILIPRVLKIGPDWWKLGSIFEVDMLMAWCQKFKRELEAAIMAQCKQVKTMQRKAKQ
jgi:hypothetical protein